MMQDRATSESVVATPRSGGGNLGTLGYDACNTPKYTLVVFNMFRVFCRHKLNFS